MDHRKTAPFREQHDRLLEIVAKISSFITDRFELSENSSTVNKLLTDLSRQLRVHLTLEDTSLYPILCHSGNEEIKKTTREYMDEMGNIKEAYAEYIARWPSGFSIKKNPEDFIKETELLFGSLGDRIERENNGLYVMIDEMFQ